MESFRLKNGNQYDQNLIQIQIEPRVGQEHFAYYVSYVFRSPKSQEVEAFMKLSDDKIMSLLQMIRS